MRFGLKASNCMNESEKDCLLMSIDKDIENLKKQKEAVAKTCDERIKQVKKWKQENAFKVIGSLTTKGIGKGLNIIFRFEDATQEDVVRLGSEYKADVLRNEYERVKRLYPRADWTEFMYNSITY